MSERIYRRVVHVNNCTVMFGSWFVVEVSYRGVAKPMSFVRGHDYLKFMAKNDCKNFKILTCSMNKTRRKPIAMHNSDMGKSK